MRLPAADLPAPLAELSPWLDWLVVPRDEVHARLAAQRHRRIVKKRPTCMSITRSAIVICR